MPSWTGPPLPAHWARTVGSTFVGRRRELTTLEEAWSATYEGARQVIFVGGEPGAGKSRLLAEVASALYRHDATVLLGSCVAELGRPYQPFVEPIEALLAGLAEGQLAFGSPRGEGDGELRGRESSAVRKRLAILVGRRSHQGEDGLDRDYRQQLYDAAVDAFRAAAARRPLVLVLEDLHWAGADGLQLLTYLVEHTAESRILVLATHRTTPPDRSLPVVHTVAELYRLEGVGRLDLGPLEVEDIMDFLVGEAGVPVSRVRTAAVALRTKTGGNPFFLRELWRDLAVHGGLAALSLSSFRAPTSVRDSVQIRLDRFPTAHREVLELAAVLGEEVDVALLAAVSADASRHARRDGILAALDEAVAHGLLEPGASSDSPVRFPHALARQAVLDLLPPSRLARDHARAAKVIESLPAADRRVQRLAHHYVGARGLGLTAQAVRYLVEAAELADRALAHEEAARLFEQASSLADGERRDDLRLAAARSHFLAAHFASARELDEQVATTGSPRDRLRGAIGYEAASYHAGQFVQRAVDLLTEALAGVQRDPSDPVYIRATASLGRALAFTGATAEASALSGRAIALARSLGRDNLLGHMLEAGLPVGHASVRLDRAAELSILAERTGNLHQLGAAAGCRCIIAYVHGDHQSLDEAHADLLRTARTTGRQHWEYLAQCVTYARQFMSGDFVAAQQTTHRLLELGEFMGAADRSEGPYGVQAYMVRRETGRLGQVGRLITGAERPTEHWAPGLVALYTELGLAEPSRRVMRWLLDEDLPRHAASADWPATLTFLVEAALWLGDGAAARSLRPMLVEYAELNLLAGTFVAVFGSADRYLGAVDSLLGQGTPDEWFASALEMDIRMRAPVHQAQTLAAQVLHLRRLGSAHRQAEDVARQLRNLAEPLGLHRVLRMIGTLGSSGHNLNARPDGLTTREIEVLRLLAVGLSNRDIADRLVISENTAANHVRSILTKTGSANRTQAARYATTRNLLG